MIKAILNHHRQVIDIFSTREEAGIALDRLILSGFPIAQVFLLGKDGGESWQNSFPLLTGEQLQARQRD